MKVETPADIERLMVERNISLVFGPSVTVQPDGSWAACYQAADLSVRGHDADEARQRLYAEQLTRMRDPNHSDWKVEAVLRHLADVPIDGDYEGNNGVADQLIDAGTQPE